MWQCDTWHPAIEAIRAIAAGGAYLSDEARTVLAAGEPTEAVQGSFASLSPRVLPRCHVSLCDIPPTMWQCDTWHPAIEAIRAIAAGGAYLSDEARTVLAAGEPTEAVQGSFASLSPRERQVLQLIAEGASSKQAASVLRVTKRTIDHHRQNLMRKLKLYSVGELTKFAIRHGLTPVDHRDPD